MTITSEYLTVTHTLPLSCLLYSKIKLWYLQNCIDEVTRTIGDIIYHGLVVLGVNMSSDSQSHWVWKLLNRCWLIRCGLLTGIFMSASRWFCWLSCRCRRSEVDITH